MHSVCVHVLLYIVQYADLNFNTGEYIDYIFILILRLTSVLLYRSLILCVPNMPI